MIRQNLRQLFSMSFLFALIVFCSLVATFWISAAVVYLQVRLGLVELAMDLAPHAGQLFTSLAIASLPVGIIVAAVASRFPLKPVRDLINSMDRLASGDFKTRVSVGPLMKNYPAFVQLTESFNKMAWELENTEVLRSDFINSISHEFKTPIVSISGFAKLLRRGNLTEGQRQEYLEIIEEESLRLSQLATNVLNLTKVENQSILTDVSEYNLSEQLRSCLLLLESRWAKKDLDFQLEFGENTIQANEDQLKQVWINLIDNAVKFSPRTGIIRLGIRETGSAYRISVTNSGPTITPEEQQKIFQKFYQADRSHAAEGNGIGLAIVKRIVELHKGTVTVVSGGGMTTFSVELPKKQ